MRDNQKLLDNAVSSLLAGRKKTAVRLLSGAVAREPADELAWLYLALALPPEKAEQATQQVLKLNPKHEIAHRITEFIQQNPGAEIELGKVWPELAAQQPAPAVPEVASPPAEPKPTRTRRPKSAPVAEKPTPEPIAKVAEVYSPEPTIDTPEIKTVEVAEASVTVPEEKPEPAIAAPESQEPTPVEPAIVATEEPEKAEVTELPPTTTSFLHPATFTEPDKSRVNDYFSRIGILSADSVEPLVSGQERANIASPPPIYMRGQTKLKSRPVRRTRGRRRIPISLTGFGLLILIIIVLLVLGYIYLMIAR